MVFSKSHRRRHLPQFLSLSPSSPSPVAQFSKSHSQCSSPHNRSPLLSLQRSCRPHHCFLRADYNRLLYDEVAPHRRPPFLCNFRRTMSNAIHDAEEVVEITPSQGAGTWPEETELYFIDLMEEEVKKGNRHTTTFIRTAWKFIEDELKKKTGKEYTHEQLKNKFNQLRQRWRNLKSLLTDTAVGYTVSTGQISATEDVWKKLYATHKYARYFRRKGCKGYDKLCIIFGDTTATGDNAHPSTKSPTISEDDKEEDEEQEEEGEVESSRAKKKSKVGGKRVPLRQQVQLAMVDAFTSMGESNRKKMEWRERKMSSTSGNSHISGASGPPGGSNEIVSCITALSALEGIDSTQFLRATRVLHDDTVWRTMFIAMPDERKKEWVLSLP